MTTVESNHENLAAELRRSTERALRYQSVLLDLAKSDWGDLPTALAKITELDARNLEVTRVSIWLFTPDRSKIVCQDMFSLQENSHSLGSDFLAKDYPRYFKALEKSRNIAAHDAVNDPRTSEFSGGYLASQAITSMLDVPFRLGGEVIGILCHEHVGPPRHWSHEDQEFASSVADIVSLVYAAEARRQAERALQKKSEELEQSNKELERFAYVASHDLQEPLYLIIAFSDRLQSRHADGLGDAGLELVRRIQRSAERMRHLVDDLLAFSRLGSKSRPFQRVELEDILAEVQKDLELRFRESHGKLHVEKLPAVEADPSQIRQLLQNLIVNALKFRRPELNPLVSVRSRDLDNGFCEITVEDNGIGFEEKYIEQIFRPFSRLHSYAEYQGSGIGLAVCQKIVQRHGGEITAHSQVGAGSKFIFTLPLAK
ncbi:MAG TPA: hypothetical protein DF383_03270 [Deltaproteobacteria bacterium]|nr:hypothetical protein [Deltaproteobacteria bacterium]